ncbi:MAG: glyoxalase superfamily protein [Myxococcota bacterium]
MNRVVPVLQIDDGNRAKAFYVEKLGFTVAFEHRHEPGFPVHKGIEHGDLFMHLSEHGRGHVGSEV